MRPLLFILTVAIISICSSTVVVAQTYLSKADAIIRLADEAKYIQSIQPQLIGADENEYIIQRQRMRFVQTMLRALKTSEGVAGVAQRYLPSGDTGRLQIGVARFEAPAGNSNRLAWLRQDLLKLITL